MARVYPIPRAAGAFEFTCLDKTDDVNGDCSEIVNYVDVYCLEKVGVTVSSTFVGSFTDRSMSVPYTPISTVDMSTVGEESLGIETLPFCDANGQNFWALYELTSGELIYSFNAQGIFNPVQPIKEGHVANASQVIPRSMTLNSAGTFKYPDNAVSFGFIVVTINNVATPPQLIDGAGQITPLDTVGLSSTNSAESSGQGTYCETPSIITNAGDVVIVTWNEAC